MKGEASRWAPGSWRGCEARQLPEYPDPAALDAALADIAAFPPLVQASEVQALKTALAEVAAGRAFLVQAGECAETFADFSLESLALTRGLIDAMAGRIETASGVRTVAVGRVAGQFAKPRTRPFERRGRMTLPAWRGDIVNGAEHDRVARIPDPVRLFRAWAQAAAGIAHLRSLPGPRPFWTSHEALLLPWEQALVRRDGAGWYGGSAHLLWIGARTAFAGSAHVELLRGLANPIGLKCGREMRPDTLARLLEALDPVREPGRITLIARMGASRIAEHLPPLIRAAVRGGHPVLWVSDPMHGNTTRGLSGDKHRRIPDIVAEYEGFVAAVRAESAWPGGLHVEMTPRDVRECEDAESSRGGQGPCDPRLNPAQAMVMAELAGQLIGCEEKAAAA